MEELPELSTSFNPGFADKVGLEVSLSALRPVKEYQTVSNFILKPPDPHGLKGSYAPHFLRTGQGKKNCFLPCSTGAQSCY